MNHYDVTAANQGLFAFIDEAVSPFHTVAAVVKRLEAAGYQPLKEAESWQIAAGGRYYVTRNGSSVIAFRLPAGKPSGYQIVASHGDSPSYKVKENAENKGALYTRINTEGYGGMLCAGWLDRPLSVAGRLAVRTDAGIRTVFVNVDRDLLLIPSVAIHMNRKANDGMTYNAAVDMVPLFGEAAAAGRYRAILAEAAGVKEEDILGTDMLLYNRQKGTVWGADGEFLSAPRLDDLQCVYSSVTALLAAAPSDAIDVCAVFDNEEVGSRTKQGAASTFLDETLRRITAALGGTPEDHCRYAASGFMLSADNAHAIHPNHPEYADNAGSPKMNGGVVIKFNANQHYTTDAVSCGIFRRLCEQAEVPTQTYANRPDMAGGSTLGNIANTQVSLNTVDIGLAQLAMHSIYETAGARDTAWMIDAMTAFFGHGLHAEGDGCYRLD